MSIKLLKNNVGVAKEITEKLLANINYQDSRSIDSRNSLLIQLKLINDSIPKILENISFYKKVNEKMDQKALVNVKYSVPGTGKQSSVVINKKDEKKLVDALQKEKSSQARGEEMDLNLKKSTAPYIRIANKFFRNISFNLSKNIFFKDTRDDLRKIGSSIVLQSYISMALFTTSLGFIFSLVLGILLMIFKVSIFASILVIILIPICVLLAFYFYPSSRVKSLEKQINQELPFLTIYLSAIATSGIEPSKIFDIIGSSEDYPISRREIRKLTNYINFFGADLVTALKFVAKNAPSERLGLLFNGLATTITSGGEITQFLKKHSETLLFDYRLEREKYTQLAETFMNIYISVVIAAPMILMVLLILMSLTGFASSSLNSVTISIASVLIISLLNLGFLLFLNTKQPKF
jgi:Flp pilus assembly protein TadB